MNIFTNDNKYIDKNTGALNPIICFSHLRWDFVYQRPQHLMERFAKQRKVFFFEEPLTTNDDVARAEYYTVDGSHVQCIRPHIPVMFSEEQTLETLQQFLSEILGASEAEPILWFYTPMMYEFAQHVRAALVIYDCMDELANFRFPPAGLQFLEQRLIQRADVMFTGGFTLYEAKKHLHDNIHPFPSGVDLEHFMSARESSANFSLKNDAPTLGYYGVIDERLDLELIQAIAKERPDWSLILIGPVAKVSKDDLPDAPNLKYLGQMAYQDLPQQLAKWDVAIMPFAMNDATHYISPTKTPEYLAGGRPVVSTPVRDVIRHFGDLKSVFIGNTAEEFISQCEAALVVSKNKRDWLEEADERIVSCTWDSVFEHMNEIMLDTLTTIKQFEAASSRQRHVGRSSRYDYIIAGAGFAGSVLAERLAVDGGKRVLICDRRAHVGGNAYDYYDASGILVHKYGPHIFHTNSDEIFTYLSQFTAWRAYEHRVLARVDDKLLPIPINRTTLNELYDLELSDEAQAAEYLKGCAQYVDTISSSKDVVIAAVGGDLYRKFFEGYTRKQWGLDPSELDKSVTARIPTRTNIDDRYFQDNIQAMPLHGYTRMFENILDHRNIDVVLETEFSDVSAAHPTAHAIFTGPVDEYFHHRFGSLPYRSLRFEHQTHDKRRFQPVAVINYPSETTPYTRVTEYKHLTGQFHRRTSISYEYACAEGDPYYPIPRLENQLLYKQYERLADQTPNVTFAGRLATYKYYNMDQVVGQALATYKRLKASRSFDEKMAKAE